MSAYVELKEKRFSWGPYQEMPKRTDYSDIIIQDLSIEKVSKDWKEKEIIFEGFSINIPKSLRKSNLLNEIRTASKSILELEDNWDGEGSKKYSKGTLKNAINFIVDYTNWIWSEREHCIPAPNIFPSSKGSIELYWKSQSYDLVINIPEFPLTKATFYGDDYGDKEISGTFSLEDKSIGIFMELLSLD